MPDEIESTLPRPRMAGESARDYLIFAKQWPSKAKLEHIRSINEAFREFWMRRPTEEEFGEVMDGMVLSSTMLYVMAAHPLTPRSAEGGMLLG